MEVTRFLQDERTVSKCGIARCLRRFTAVDAKEYATYMQTRQTGHTTDLWTRIFALEKKAKQHSRRTSHWAQPTKKNTNVHDSVKIKGRHNHRQPHSHISPSSVSHGREGSWRNFCFLSVMGPASVPHCRLPFFCCAFSLLPCLPPVAALLPF